eukprot:CAMPEP_0178810678 /NCGR_PEP_ID=MMETSP0745-20121128/18820_1 /TAXON_ID=913974 /ORGANISM="Nitzschia punctata, Strain CCMP561" /LENGTH=75 /DNA_ID=CAMNT_0020471219 /DNA_START=693 /DNA_END=920 /DNA_ORIENTATION=+
MSSLPANNISSSNGRSSALELTADDCRLYWTLSSSSEESSSSSSLLFHNKADEEESTFALIDNSVAAFFDSSLPV